MVATVENVLQSKLRKEEEEEQGGNKEGEEGRKKKKEESKRPRAWDASGTWFAIGCKCEMIVKLRSVWGVRCWRVRGILGLGSHCVWTQSEMTKPKPWRKAWPIAQSLFLLQKAPLHKSFRLLSRKSRSVCGTFLHLLPRRRPFFHAHVSICYILKSQKPRGGVLR